MPGVMFGMCVDLKPVIPCTVINPATNEGGECTKLDCRGLVDTGATDIVIRSEHVALLGLLETGEPTLNYGVGFAGSNRTYRVDLLLRGRKLAQLENEFAYTLTDARALEASLGPVQDYDIIIGMNCLIYMDVRFTPGGWFELRFG